MWVTSKKYSSSIDPETGEASWDDNLNSWSEPAKYSYIPEKGVDYFDGGSYVSYVFNTKLQGTVPTISGGYYDGTTEYIPLEWSDNPTLAEGNQAVWVSMNRYTKLPNSDDWSEANFSEPALFTANQKLGGYLTNESHTATSSSSGNNVNLSGSAGRFWSYMGSKNISGLNSTVYQVVSISGGANITIDAVGNYQVISMGDENVAVAVFSVTDTPSGQTIEKKYTIAKALSGPPGLDGQRGTRRFYKFTQYIKWEDFEAEQAITDALVIKMDWDIVTLYNKGEGFSETKYWSQPENKWKLLVEVIDGNLLVDGTIITNKIKAGAITTSKLQADIIIGEDAEFKGTLKAAKGNFTGELNIGDGDLSTHIQQGFIWTGATDYSDAPFKVTNLGQLIASGAYIRGNLEATSLEANTLMVGSGNIYDLSVDTLKIKGGAVTVTVFGKGSGFDIQGSSIGYSPTITFYPSGGGYILTGTAWAEANDNDGRISVGLQIRNYSQNSNGDYVYSNWSQVNTYFAGVRVDSGAEGTWELPLPCCYADSSETRAMQARMKFYNANALIKIKSPLIYAMSGKR